MKIDGTIGFVGTGNKGEALIRGLLKAGVAEPSHILGRDPRSDRAAELAEKYGIRTTGDNTEVARQSDILILSIKPQVMERVLEEIGPEIHAQALVISIAAGVPLAAIESRLPQARVIRTMPNTPALVGAGATAIAVGGHATDDDLQAAHRIFDSVGMTVALDEAQMDAVTGLSGSGPAYVFLVIEALADAGVKVGLSRHHAQALAAQTLLGSAKLLIETNEHPGRLKDMVTSPGGTAIAGLHTLEAGGLRTTLMDAVEAATKRSRELGEEAVKPDKR